jgi:hypothetical protein
MVEQRCQPFIGIDWAFMVSSPTADAVYRRLGAGRHLAPGPVDELVRGCCETVAVRAAVEAVRNEGGERCTV